MVKKRFAAILKIITRILIGSILLACCDLAIANILAGKNYRVVGIKGEVLTNVEKRLDALNSKQSLKKLNEELLRKQIASSLEPYGYLEPEIQILNQKKLNIIISPGPRIILNSVSITLIGPGKNNLALQQAKHKSLLVVGEPLNIALYNQTKNNIVNAGEQQGYLRGNFITAEILIDKRNHTANIHLIYNSRKRYYFGPIHFNPTFISQNLLNRYVPFKPGAFYSTDDILKLNQRLDNSGYFSAVNINPLITDNSATVPINILLTPAPRYSYALGAGYGTDTGIRGTTSYHINPVNSSGHRFDAIAQGSFVQNTVQLQYSIPGVDPVTDRYLLSGMGGNLNYASGYSNALQFTAAQQHQKENYQRTLSINELYEEFYYKDQDQTKETTSTVFLKGFWRFSNTHHQLFSPSGYSVSFNALGASKVLLSDISFGQASVDAKLAYTFQSIHTRFLLHGIQGFTAINHIQNLPLSLAQLLGGNENLKGYSFNSIGPGNMISYGGLEMQNKIINDWHFISFIDAGAVYNAKQASLYRDAGIGVMWVSPLGPIKLGIAQAFDEGFKAVRSPRIVFNIGPDL